MRNAEVILQRATQQFMEWYRDQDGRPATESHRRGFIEHVGRQIPIIIEVFDQLDLSDKLVTLERCNQFTAAILARTLDHSSMPDLHIPAAYAALGTHRDECHQGANATLARYGAKNGLAFLLSDGSALSSESRALLENDALTYDVLIDTDPLSIVRSVTVL
jgi:hypothetical protein